MLSQCWFAFGKVNPEKSITTTKVMWHWRPHGRSLGESIKTIHSGFCWVLPNIHTHQTSFIAEAYAFWFHHLTPILLKDRFPDNLYYKHAMELIQIINTCIKFEITLSEADQLELEIKNWVIEFENMLSKFVLYFIHYPSSSACTTNATTSSCHYACSQYTPSCT